MAGGHFVAYFVVALLVLIAQPFKPKKRDLFEGKSKTATSVLQVG